MPSPSSAALSHVGRVRSQNQDSGYAGTHLFFVADGMGGHAGGDVASALATTRIAEADRVYSSTQEAEEALRETLLAANALLSDTVQDHHELTGMGTTVSGFVRVGNQVVVAHIGDSRVYRFRAGTIEQVTVDHTFVQRLVDTGRITAEEAAVHPRRSVLMRVLGDIDQSPEIDTKVLETRPGDRWLACSDGLSSYVSDDKLMQIFTQNRTASAVAERLVKESLDQGAPDNVTVVVLDIDSLDDVHPAPAVVVGSAAAPVRFAGGTERKLVRLPSLLLHPLKSTVVDDEHFEPERDAYLEELIEEDRRRRIRRRVTAAVLVTLAAVAVATALSLAYQWTQTRYYVGVADGNVAIYRGVQATIGPWGLSSVFQRTGIDIDDLPPFERAAVDGTINANDLRDAQAIVNRLQDAAED